MKKFEERNSRESQGVDEHRDRLYPIRSEGRYVVPTNPWPRDSEKEMRDIAGVQKRKPYTHRRQLHKGIDGTSMVSHLPQLPQRHTS